MKQSLLDHLKNIPGWRSSRKLIAFAVDDYGNVRLESKKAKGRLEREGISLDNRFDQFDTLETGQDLHVLFETLRSVKDSKGNPAAFTPYALSANIDFDSLKNSRSLEYKYEDLFSTFQRLSSEFLADYQDTVNLIQQGIDEKLFEPQYHGREHLHIPTFERKLKESDESIIASIKNNCYAGISREGKPTWGWTAAFSYWNFEEERNALVPAFEEGINLFEKFYGYRPICFTAPAQQFPKEMEPLIIKNGLEFFDCPLYQNRHIGNGRHKREISVSGFESRKGYKKIVRNVVFEPSENRGFDWVNYTMKQIETAFFWNKPAIISSHRVNFCGYIDENNRKQGISALRSLLQKIVKKWPDVEFVTIKDLAEIMLKEQ